MTAGPPIVFDALLSLTRSSAIAERPARRSVLVEMPSYCCTNGITQTDRVPAWAPSATATSCPVWAWSSPHSLLSLHFPTSPPSTPSFSIFTRIDFNLPIWRPRYAWVTPWEFRRDLRQQKTSPWAIVWRCLRDPRFSPNLAQAHPDGQHKNQGIMSHQSVSKVDRTQHWIHHQNNNNKKLAFNMENAH